VGSTREIEHAVLPNSRTPAKRPALRFGVLQFFSWPQRRVPLPVVYERALERIRIMESSGYDSVWLAEHHFTGYSVCPSVHMMGVHVAAQTTRLRIGMGVSLAAFYHPLRLAEEVALLDVLSGGRVNWGAGRGFDPIEFRIFGIPVEESRARLHEAVEIVLAAWTNERVTWSGRFWQFEDVEVLPKPLQQPHPPVWLAAGSTGALRWAARNGYSIMLGPHATFDENAEHRELYRRTLEQNGAELDGRVLPMARMIAIADREDDAEEIARRGVEWLAGSYINASKVTAPTHDAQAFLQLERDKLMRRYIDSVVIHGSPDRVADRIAALREEMHLDYLMCVPLSHASFTAFTDKVMPNL
jgi:alkanesulfonate monooxygenase SsuD/methylene tetrahydromethanopterin reductase-like flavin-dependent oxidoreductase (luciferase family)